MQSVTGVEDLQHLQPAFDDRQGRWSNKADSILTSIWLEMIGNRPRAKRSLARCYAQLTAFVEETRRLEEACSEKHRAGRHFHSGILSVLKLTLAIQIIMAGFDLQLYSPAELGAAYWLAARFATQRREARERIFINCLASDLLDEQADPLPDLWFESCCLGYSLLIVGPLRSSASNKTAPWMADEEHTKAVFRRRFKWLASSGVPRHEQLASIDLVWQQYHSWKTGVLAEMPSVVATRCIAHLKSATRLLPPVLHGIAESAGRWQLCRDDASQVRTIELAPRFQSS